jgi:hypothetical protein|nr:hypothetical protein [uncultured Brevundimonas sp.]
MKRAEQAALIAERIHRALQRAEAGQDQSIDRLGRLALALTKGRRDAGLAATVGQPAFDALARALAAQVSAQKAMVELHEALADVKGATRFRSVRLGGLQKSETDVPRETRLTLVERRA